MCINFWTDNEKYFILKFKLKEVHHWIFRVWTKFHKFKSWSKKKNSFRTKKKKIAFPAIIKKRFKIFKLNQYSLEKSFYFSLKVNTAIISIFFLPEYLEHLFLFKFHCLLLAIYANNNKNVEIETLFIQYFLAFLP